MSRPALFVGSSSEGLRIAQAVQVCLDSVCKVELWTQGVFGLTQGTLESLVMALPRFDFAILVLTVDDLTISHGMAKAAPRDNVLFELGLFIGSFGRDRTFMIYDLADSPALPSDVAGMTAATFTPHSTGNLVATLGAACAKIQNGIERLGIRESRGLRDLEKATLNVEGVGETTQSLLRLLARSRKVELDIIATQFGSMIGPPRLQQMRRDWLTWKERWARTRQPPTGCTQMPRQRISGLGELAVPRTLCAHRAAESGRSPDRAPRGQ